MIEFLLLDLDDTILDFHKAERVAICQTFTQLGVEPTPVLLERYHIINIAHWQMLERGELTREQVLVQRFAVLLTGLYACRDDRKGGDAFLTGFRLSCHVQIFWCLLQLALFNTIGLDINRTLFSGAALSSHYRGGTLVCTGLHWHAANMIPFLCSIISTAPSFGTKRWLFWWQLAQKTPPVSLL